jgi:Ca2+-binding RTX toxin-like protein
MAIFARVQTIWAADLPVLGQISRLDVTAGGSPELVIHDRATRQRASLDLGAGLLDPAAARYGPSGGDRQALVLEGRDRTLDAATLEGLAGDRDSATAYLDGVGFSGNLAALHRSTISGQPYLFVAAAYGAGLTAYRIAPNGALSPAYSLADGPGRYLAGVTALDSLGVDGSRFLIAASSRENGLSVFEIGAGGSLTLTGSFGFAEQLPVDRPSAMTTVETGGRSYVLLASFGSASLSVLELRGDGSLRFVDQVIDSLETRFDAVAALDVITVAGQVLVALAGSDGGVSLFQMLPGGRLLHRETIIDDAQSALDGVRQLRFVSVEGRVELLVLATGEAGVGPGGGTGLTRLTLDLGSPGVTGGGAGTAGNDVLSAAPGGALLRGGAGDDILIDGAGNDTLWGGGGGDVFVFGPDDGADTIADFNLAEDRIDLSGFAFLYTAGDLSVTATPGGATLRWGLETLTVRTGDGAALRAGDLNDRLLFNSDHVIMPDPLPIVGGAGNDSFVWSAYADTVDGGAGYDTMIYTAASIHVVVDLSDQQRNAAAAAGDVLMNIEGLTGTSGNDSFTGDGRNNTLIGLRGNDRLSGGAGNDWITPGAGNDTVDGGAGSDMVSFVDLARGVNANLGTGLARSNGDTNILINIESVTGTILGDFIQGDAGNNRIRGLGDYDWLVGSGGNDVFDGGTGRDMVSYVYVYVYAAAGVTVDLGAGRGSAGQAAGDRYVSIERITGSVYDDLIYGSDGADDFRGLGGYDWFVGSDGGKDRYDGGSGRDTVAYSGSPGGVVASLLLGRGSGGEAARDLYTSVENLTGSSFDDILTGDNGRNVLRGLYGQDRLFGNGGVDRLTGGGSDDYLDGGSGWDYAIFAGNRAEYSVTTSGAQTIVARIAAGGEGTDTLVNIEALQFADGFLFL